MFRSTKSFLITLSEIQTEYSSQLHNVLMDGDCNQGKDDYSDIQYMIVH